MEQAKKNNTKKTPKNKKKTKQNTKKQTNKQKIANCQTDLENIRHLIFYCKRV